MNQPPIYESDSKTENLLDLQRRFVQKSSAFTDIPADGWRKVVAKRNDLDDLVRPTQGPILHP
jgi:hypothetical protein